MKKRVLYEKSREHPAKRFSLYWDVPEPLLVYAYNDIYTDGKGVGYSHDRLSFSIGLIGKVVSRDKFRAFIVAANKYNIWVNKFMLMREKDALAKIEEAYGRRPIR